MLFYESTSQEIAFLQLSGRVYRVYLPFRGVCLSFWGQHKMSCGKTIREVHEEKQWTTRCCWRVRIFVVYVTLVSIGRLDMHSRIKSRQQKKIIWENTLKLQEANSKGLNTSLLFLRVHCLSILKLLEYFSNQWLHLCWTCPEILEFAPALRTVGNLHGSFHKSLAVSGMVPSNLAK